MINNNKTLFKKLNGSFKLLFDEINNVTNRMDEYEKMSGYEQGFIDGIFSISNKIDNDYRPFLSDSLAEYIEEYLENNKDCPPSGCDSLEECAEIFTYDFLMYYEEMVMDLLKKNYIVHLASFLEIDLTDDPEKLFFVQDTNKWKLGMPMNLCFTTVLA